MLKTLGLALGASLSLLLAAAAEAQEASPAPRMVQLDGSAVRVQTIGLETRKRGAPVVVFEAGLVSSLEAWRSVVGDVSEMAPVVAYDRAGLGKSERDGVRPAPGHVTGRLRRLLRLVGAEPPYVLVGHSWGGVLTHYYAGRYPDEVAGLVFVDPAPVLTQPLSGNLVPFQAIGAGPAGFDAYWSTFGNVVSRAGPAAQAEFQVLRDLLQSEQSARDLRPLPKVPVVVLVAGQYLALPFHYPFDAKAHFEADLRHRLKLLQEWALASPDGLLLVSRTTSHSIPREEPQLITWGISRVLELANKSR